MSREPMTPNRLPLPADCAVLWDILDALTNATHAGNDNPDTGMFEVLHGRLVRYEPGKMAIPYDAVERLVALKWVELTPPGDDREFGYEVTNAGRYQLDKWHKRMWILYKRTRLRVLPGTGGGGE